MNILYVCSDFDVPFRGPEGCSIHVRDLTRALVASGHEVSVLCSSLGDGKVAPTGARVRELSPPSDLALIWASLESEPVVQEHLLDNDLWLTIEQPGLGPLTMPAPVLGPAGPPAPAPSCGEHNAAGVLWAAGTPV